MNQYLDSPENPPQSLWNYALRWGLIGTGLTALYGLLMFVLGRNDQGWGTFLINLALFAGVIFMSMKEFRDKENGGTISFGNAYGTGMATTLVIAISSAVWVFLFFTFIAPNMLEEMKTLTMQQLEEQEMSEEDIRTSMQFMSAMFTPVAMVIGTLINVAISGAIVSLVCAAINKK